MTTHTRQSSLYTLRVNTASQAAALAAVLPVIQDHGPTHVGFRAADDTDATEQATAALHAAGLDHVAATLTTGLGAHRRDVAVQDATTWEEQQTAVAAFSTAHPHFPADQRHTIRRDGATLVCLTCGPDSAIHAPTVPAPPVSGIAASASRFD